MKDPNTRQYSFNEVQRARARYKSIAGLNNLFYAWVLDSRIRSTRGEVNAAPAAVLIGSAAHDKMEMLLSEHWETLLKAYLIRHPEK